MINQYFKIKNGMQMHGLEEVLRNKENNDSFIGNKNNKNNLDNIGNLKR